MTGRVGMSGTPAVPRPTRQSVDVRRRHPVIRASRDQLAESLLAFAANDEVDVVARLVRLRREARIVAADDDAGLRTELADEPRDAERRRALKRHHRQPDDVGRPFANQPRDRAPHIAPHENEVGDGDPVVGVDVARERRERAVRHANRDRRHVLEGVGHRQQQDIHRRCASASLNHKPAQAEAYRAFRPRTCQEDVRPPAPCEIAKLLRRRQRGSLVRRSNW